VFVAIEACLNLHPTIAISTNTDRFLLDAWIAAPIPLGIFITNRDRSLLVSNHALVVMFFSRQIPAAGKLYPFQSAANLVFPQPAPLNDAI
jgi:hypothetical protein